MPYQVIAQQGPRAREPGKLLWTCCLNGEKSEGPRGGDACTPCRRCEAFLETKNRRCRMTTCLDAKYCHYHLANPFRKTLDSQVTTHIGLKIAEDNALGRKLVAARDFARGEFIMPVAYENLATRAFNRRYKVRDRRNNAVDATAPYGMALEGRGRQGDAACVRSAPSYANDPRGQGPGAKVNAGFVYSDHGMPYPGLWFRATAPIKKNDTIWVKYGREYWNDHGFIEFSLKYKRGRVMTVPTYQHAHRKKVAAKQLTPRIRLPALSLKRSTIPQAGNGVFAEEDIAKNQIITEYGGRVVDRDEALALMRDGRDTHIIGIDHDAKYDGRVQHGFPLRYYVSNHLMASFVNDFYGTQNTANAKTIKKGGGITPHGDEVPSRVFLQATRDIPRGAEIFITYDATYHARHFPQQ